MSINSPSMNDYYISEDFLSSQMYNTMLAINSELLNDDIDNYEEGCIYYCTDTNNMYIKYNNEFTLIGNSLSSSNESPINRLDIDNLIQKQFKCECCDGRLDLSKGVHHESYLSVNALKAL